MDSFLTHPPSVYSDVFTSQYSDVFTSQYSDYSHLFTTYAIDSIALLIACICLLGVYYRQWPLIECWMAIAVYGVVRIALAKLNIATACYGECIAIGLFFIALISSDTFHQLCTDPCFWMSLSIGACEFFLPAHHTLAVITSSMFMSFSFVCLYSD